MFGYRLGYLNLNIYFIHLLLRLITTTASPTTTINTYSTWNISFSTKSLLAPKTVLHNPFDTNEIDLRASIATTNSTTNQNIFGYYDGLQWYIRYTPSIPATYRYNITLSLNASQPSIIKSGVFIVVPSSPSSSSSSSSRRSLGFIRQSKQNTRYFVYEQPSAQSITTTYWPIGLNLCGYVYKQSNITDQFTQWFDTLSKNNGNFARLWSVDNVNDTSGIYQLALNTGPEWGVYNMSNAQKLDDIFQLALDRGINIQLTLNDQHSLRQDKRWPLNFANVQNGGPLKSPKEWFTNTGKVRSMFVRRLRYLVARYSSYPNLMAWESFNEIDFVDEYNEKDVYAWHKNIFVPFLQQNDPYHHLTTTSWALTRGGASSNLHSETDSATLLDFVQTHHYDPWELEKEPPPNSPLGNLQFGDQGTFLIGANWRKQRMYPLKPHFVGEFGIGPLATKIERTTALHNGLWGSVVSASSGAASTWYWSIQNYVDYTEFKPLQKAVENWPFAERKWSMLSVVTSSSSGGGGLQGFGMSGRYLADGSAKNDDVCAKQMPAIRCDAVDASTHIWIWLRKEECTFSQQKKNVTVFSGDDHEYNVTLMGDVSLGLYEVKIINTTTGIGDVVDKAKQCYEGVCQIEAPKDIACDVAMTLTLL